MLGFQANPNGSSVYASASSPPTIVDSRLEPAVERIESSKPSLTCLMSAGPLASGIL